jgi:hypothetical protein
MQEIIFAAILFSKVERLTTIIAPFSTDTMGFVIPTLLRTKHETKVSKVSLPETWKMPFFVVVSFKNPPRISNSSNNKEPWLITLKNP